MRHHLGCAPGTVSWGALPTERTPPVLEVDSGDVVVFDTVSQEGLMPDQGRDPVSYFGAFGVPADGVLAEAAEIAASGLGPTLGPHLVLGPVRVRQARPGDWLRGEFLDFDPRVPYGVISSRHGRGALPGELPSKPLVSRFCALTPDGRYAVFPHRGGEALIEVRPFLGLCGVTPAGPEALGTIPPGPYGGNLDLRELTAGSTLHLPVQTEGAGFYVGDPHFAQGNGEVALTALEGSLRATVRLSVADAGPGATTWPLAETPDAWITVGLDEDLGEAMRQCVRQAVHLLREVTGMSADEAYLYLSGAGDFALTQVVDITQGVHCRISKALIADPCVGRFPERAPVYDH
ncbi:acetamidase/formamidase family protein [Streptosporangium sp. NBC_01755]|uniref:acetamidase/formamidase family protein n=1 Tax=Streptosporangium sp. NBC_01755 TaxID=2975949 RepID=UPI002DDBB050|nr:acetamidase/formamidase family protein [Streptosporangium sp. NBC_01755]WSD02809.1 acetamidase/formamidase family protein [Streptosporangium sp. NBC_01755]